MKRIYLVILFVGALLLGAQQASAATLFFSPASGSYQVGSSFSVSVYVNSASQAMNAASGTVSFPSNTLKITSLSKAGSIMNLWTQEPSFSNAAGTAQFEGIVLNPGYTGSSGKLITLQFTVLSQGSGAITFSSSSVLANDGEGSNILTSSGSAHFTFVASSVEVLPTFPSTGTTPLISPVFTQWPGRLQEGQRLVALGKSAYANSTVEVLSRSNDEDEKSSIVVTDSAGNFTFSDEENVKSGVYILWARALDARGAKSYPTEKIVITVQSLSFLQRVIVWWRSLRIILYLALGIFIVLCLVCFMYRALHRRLQN
jgi:hypothetical protein